MFQRKKEVDNENEGGRQLVYYLMLLLNRTKRWRRYYGIGEEKKKTYIIKTKNKL